MIVSTKKRWPPSLPLVLSEAKALMAFMNGLAARPWVGTPVFFGPVWRSRIHPLG